MSQNWEVVIGLEIHAQLATKSKIFSTAPTAYGAEPNTQACALDLAMPGTLPVLNKEVVEMAARFGLAINADVARQCIFDRKNYFYPDLPKGYQISQLAAPIVNGGWVEIDLEDGERKRINLTRAHLEEDAGKSLHESFHGMTGIDLNRAGTPLLEIVSEPEMTSAKQAVAYMRKVHSLVRYLGICDGNMQEGSFRCDANVSIRPVGQKELGTRTELKNINSFRFVERAIDYEVVRQAHVLEAGGKVVQETRLYDAERHETRSMRSKEEAHDYRYFPDPDLLPVVISEQELRNWAKQIPELPDAKQARYQNQWGLSTEDALAMSEDRGNAIYFESLVQKLGTEHARIACNWIRGELFAALNKAGLDIANSPVSGEQLAGLLKRLIDKTVSGKIAKDVFQAIWDGEGDADAIIEKRGLKQISDSGAIETMVDEVIANFPEQVENYRNGQTKLLQFMVGQVMKASRGKANPGQVSTLLREKLG